MKRNIQFVFLIKNNNLLHLAIKSENGSVIKSLLDKGLDINEKNDYNQPAYYSALNNNNVELMRFLAENAKIDFNVTIGSKDSNLGFFQSNSNLGRKA